VVVCAPNEMRTECVWTTVWPDCPEPRCAEADRPTETSGVDCEWECATNLATDASHWVEHCGEPACDCSSLSPRRVECNDGTVVETSSSSPCLVSASGECYRELPRCHDDSDPAADDHCAGIPEGRLCADGSLGGELSVCQCDGNPPVCEWLRRTCAEPTRTAPCNCQDDHSVCLDNGECRQLVQVHVELRPPSGSDSCSNVETIADLVRAEVDRQVACAECDVSVAVLDDCEFLLSAAVPESRLLDASADQVANAVASDQTADAVGRDQDGASALTATPVGAAGTSSAATLGVCSLLLTAVLLLVLA